MGTSPSRDPELPEGHLDRLGRRLNRHRLWNCLLAVFPPCLLLAYAVALLFLSERVGLGAVIFFAAAILGVGLAAVLHFKTTLPTREKVARLMDDHAGGKEHFRTLATVDPSRARPSALARLRFQASSLLRRVNFERDFPYRIGPGPACSLVFSLLFVVLLHFFVVDPVLSVPDGTALDKVPALARQFSRESGLEAVASSAGRAAGELRQTIRDTPMVRKVMEQVKARLGAGSNRGREAGQGRDPAATNERSGGQGKRPAGNTAGTEEAPGPGQEPGAAGQKPGEDPGGLAQSSDGDRGEQEPDRGNTPKGEAESKPGGPSEQDGREQTARKEDAPEGEAGRKTGSGGASDAGEDVPQGEEPDRFHRPGEGTEGIEGGRFVTVALPKALSTGRGGESVAGETRGGSDGRIPLSNVPLPPRKESAAGEKQHMPLEYKGLIQ